MVCCSSSPTMPPKTNPPQAGQKLRTDSPPRNDAHLNCRAGPLMRTLDAAKPMNGTKPDPDAFLQSAQKQ